MKGDQELPTRVEVLAEQAQELETEPRIEVENPSEVVRSYRSEDTVGIGFDSVFMGTQKNRFGKSKRLSFECLARDPGTRTRIDDKPRAARPENVNIFCRITASEQTCASGEKDVARGSLELFRKSFGNLTYKFTEENGIAKEISLICVDFPHNCPRRNQSSSGGWSHRFRGFL